MKFEDRLIVNQAINILEAELRRDNAIISDPETAKNYCIVMLSELKHEVFAVLFIDNRHRVIEFVEMFQGTINGAVVHIREIAKKALELNAAAIIMTHNHPSAVPEPSEADRRLTDRIVDALNIFDIRTLDHIVVGGTKTVSFSERGLL